MSVETFSEPKAQRWRALAILENGDEALVFVGANVKQVKEGYGEPWFDLFDDADRDTAKEMRLQKWIGDPDRGSWSTESLLPIPILGGGL